MDRDFDACRDIIEHGNTFVLTTHINPDGDGLGSELALYVYLTGRGKRAHILNHSATPFNYEFLDPHRRITRFDPKQHSDLVLSADVIFVLDTNHPDRLDGLKPVVLASNARKICIDHHLDPAEFADLYLIDDASAATGQIVYRLLTHLDAQSITAEVALPLYTAIMTDTGSFRFPKTDADLFRIIAHLVECGADPVQVYQEVYEQGSAGRMHLLGRALAGLRLLHDGKVAYLVVDRTMFRETKTGEADTDNFISYTLFVKGVQIGLLFTEMEDEIKVSFRSKGEIPINRLAQLFGGNGHKNAAGARVRGAKLNDVVRNVLRSARQFVI